MTRLVIAECRTDTDRMLADVRRVLQMAKPELVAEFDGLDRAAMSGQQFLGWLNQKIGSTLNGATLRVMDTPLALARHLGIVGFEPDWDIIVEDD